MVSIVEHLRALGSVFRLVLQSQRILLLLFCSYFLAVTLLVVSMPFSSATTRFLQQRFHFDLPFPVWAVVQPVPSMYNFVNRVYRSESPELIEAWRRNGSRDPDHLLTNSQILRQGAPVKLFGVVAKVITHNHHPMREFHSLSRKRKYRKRNTCWYYLLQSSFPTAAHVTPYSLCVLNDGKRRLKRY